MIRLSPRLLVVGVLLVGVVARAHHDPFGRLDLIPVKPTPTMEGGFALESATFATARSYRFSLLADLNAGVLALKSGNEKIGDLIPFRADLQLMAAYSLHRMVELSVALPLTIGQFNNFRLLEREGFPQRAPSVVGIGSLRLLPRFSILNPATFPLGLAAVTELRLPALSADSFIGDAGFVFAPRLVAERSFGPVKILANMGYRLRPYHTQFLNLYLGNEFVSGVGAVVDLPDWRDFSQLQVVAEMHLVTPTEAPFTFSQADSLKTPWELLVGVRGRVRRNLSAQVQFGRGLGLESGYGREAFRMVFGLAYEVQHADRDGDDIPDHEDGCPDEKEDHDGFNDSDGCPDPDNDNDGVLDTEDMCPMDPGPRELEGCPDSDGDSLPDVVDKCPNEAGPVDNEGCPVNEPEVELESDRIRVRGQIQFETNEATIKSESYKMLDDVYKVLADNPGVGPVLIEGHTDNRGSRAHNLDLSRRRAKSVEDYLVNKGIDKKRLRSAGFGFDKPIADNATPLGRAKNRRTEFRLVSEVETPATIKPAGGATPKKKK